MVIHTRMLYMFQVWTLPRGARALTTHTNFIDPFILRYRLNRERMIKYVSRGFSVLLFEICIHQPRCDCVLDGKVWCVKGWW